MLLNPGDKFLESLESFSNILPRPTLNLPHQYLLTEIWKKCSIWKSFPRKFWHLLTLYCCPFQSTRPELRWFKFWLITWSRHSHLLISASNLPWIASAFSRSLTDKNETINNIFLSKWKNIFIINTSVSEWCVLYHVLVLCFFYLRYTLSVS